MSNPCSLGDSRLQCRLRRVFVIRSRRGDSDFANIAYPRSSLSGEVMKPLRLVLGVIGVVTATIVATAQATPPAAPEQTPAAPVPNGPAAAGAQGRGGGQQVPVPGAPPVAAIDSPLLRNYSTVTK